LEERNALPTLPFSDAPVLLYFSIGNHPKGTLISIGLFARLPYNRFPESLLQRTSVSRLRLPGGY